MSQITNESKLTSARLSEAIADNSLRPIDVSEKTGISKGALSHFLKGTRIPSRDSAEKLGKVLSVNPVWLMGFNVDKYLPITTTNHDKYTSQALDYFNQLNDLQKESIINLMKSILNQ